MRKFPVLPILLLVVSLLTITCKKDSGGTAAPDYNGNWSGTTSQGKAFSFTVSGNTVTIIDIAYTLTGNCSPFPTASHITVTTGGAINGNSFSITGGTSISGTFSSANAATGTFTSNFAGGSPPGCSSTASGTWSAIK